MEKKTIEDRKNQIVEFFKDHKSEIIFGSSMIASTVGLLILDRKLSDTSNKSNIANAYRGLKYLDRLSKYDDFKMAIGKSDYVWYHEKYGVAAFVPTEEELDRLADDLKNCNDEVPAQLLKFANILVEHHKGLNK